jgi:hypothetical protein
MPMDTIHSINFFRFEVDPSVISSTIKGGFIRLHKLNLNISGFYVSSANLAKIAECWLDLEKLILSNMEGDLKLSLSDMKIIASLPHLNHLEIHCEIDDKAVSALTRCRGLNHLKLFWRDGMLALL